MRIAFFTRCLPAHGLGGMEIHASQVARGLAARGHQVIVYTTRLPQGPRVEVDGNLHIHYLAGTRPRSYLGGYATAGRTAFQQENAHAPFDVVYSESSGALSLLRDREPSVPVVVFLVGTAAAELRSKLRQLPRPRALLGIGWNLIGHLQSRRYLPRAARVLCESEGLRAWALRELPLDPARVSVAWLGVDTKRFTPDGPILPEIEALAPDATRVVFGGRLEKEKGFDIAIRALLPILPAREGVAAFLVGEGREKKDLLQRAAPLSRSGRFHWLKPVPYERLQEMYRAAAIYLMPTIRLEGSALSLVEAMACGRAVVASRVGGLPSLLRDGQDALLVPPGDPEALRAAVLRLLEDPALRARLGAEAHRIACTRYSIDGMLDEIERALRAAAGGRR